MTIDGYVDVPANNEKMLLQAVANQPVSVGISGGERAFQLYSKVGVKLPSALATKNTLTRFLLAVVLMHEFFVGGFHRSMFNFSGSCCIDSRVWIAKWS